MPCGYPHVFPSASVTNPISAVEQSGEGCPVRSELSEHSTQSSRALQQCSLSWLLPISLSLEMEASSPLIMSLCGHITGGYLQTL